MKQHLRRVARRALVSLKLLRLARFRSAILMYHRFRPDNADGYVTTRSDFAAQMKFLRDNFDVVPLAEALAARPRRRPAVAITVDDGYRSFAEIAHPVLRELGLTATVFLPIRFVDEGGWLWQDRPIHLLRAATPGQHAFAWRGQKVAIDTRDREHLFRTLERFYLLAFPLSASERDDLAASLAETLRVPLPARPPAEFAPLTWSQVRELQDQGVTFGSHTLTHQILTHCSAETAQREIADSRVELAARLDRAVPFFAYPNGDFNPDLSRMVATAGYDYALSTDRGFWRPGNDPYAVKRIPAPATGADPLAERLLRYWLRYR